MFICKCDYWKQMSPSDLRLLEKVDTDKHEGTVVYQLPLMRFPFVRTFCFRVNVSITALSSIHGAWLIFPIELFKFHWFHHSLDHSLHGSRKLWDLVESHFVQVTLNFLQLKEHKCTSHLSPWKKYVGMFKMSWFDCSNFSVPCNRLSDYLCRL